MYVVLGLRENKTENIGENIITKMAGIAWSGGCVASEPQAHRTTSEGMMPCRGSSEAAGHARAIDAESYADFWAEGRSPAEANEQHTSPVRFSWTLWMGSSFQR